MSSMIQWLTLWEMGLLVEDVVNLEDKLAVVEAPKIIEIFKGSKLQLIKAGITKVQTLHLQKKTQECLVWMNMSLNPRDLI
jgi:hypothetical protein